jgi:L-rhamnose mutarotase
MITSMSPNEVLNYIKNIHKTIDSNNRQSDSVINNYSIFTEKLSNLAYESFKNLDSDNKKSSLYELAKVVSGR